MGVDHQTNLKALSGFQVDKWNLEALSEATLTRVAGSAMTVHMTLFAHDQLVENQVDGSQVVEVEVVFCLKLGIKG